MVGERTAVGCLCEPLKTTTPHLERSRLVLYMHRIPYIFGEIHGMILY